MRFNQDYKLSIVNELISILIVTYLVADLSTTNQLKNLLFYILNHNGCTEIALP